MYEWNPLEVVKSALIAGQVPRDKYGCELQYTIILLNQKVLNEDLFLALWNEGIHICKNLYQIYNDLFCYSKKLHSEC
jgi:hypothetical protein